MVVAPLFWPTLYTGIKLTHAVKVMHAFASQSHWHNRHRRRCSRRAQTNVATEKSRTPRSDLNATTSTQH